MSGGVLGDGNPGLMGSTRRTVQLATLVNVTISPQDDEIIVDCVGASTINLPPLADVANGFSLRVVARAGATLDATIDPNGTEQINGLGAGTPLVLTTANFESVLVYKANDQWIGT